MPKKKKTREQKITAEKRRKTEKPSAKLTTPLSTHIYKSEEIKTTPQVQARSTAIATNDYSYLVSDLTKTVLLTSGIIIAEYILFISFF